MYWTLAIAIFGFAALVHGLEPIDIMTQRWSHGQWANEFDSSKAVVGGYELPDSGNIWVQYICRVQIGKEYKPGKYVPDFSPGCCYITNATSEGQIRVCDGSRLQFLHQDQQTNNCSWVARYDGHIWDGAVLGGATAEYQPYFICRADLNDSGKIIPVSGSLLLLNGFCSVSKGKAFKFPVYHVLRDENHYCQQNNV